MNRGEAKIEFYSNLGYLQNEYNNGLVISKFLYQKAVQEKNFKMGYPQFNTYFNRVFGTPKIKKQIIEVEENVHVESKKIKESFEPIRAKINTKEKKVFSALHGKEFSDTDIL